jgi:UDP-N-acetylglucosamine--N-acetylmuramyl-(pentapeptide) pyrophosphoryl-undecaprenol N-acetylglucosamine transferase
VTIARKIILTGGGTAGHVMPHMAILPELRRNGFNPIYIGSGGIEKDIARKYDVPFFQISTGKLRRYFSIDNFLDVFRIIYGFLQSLNLMIRLRPDVVFSKGGFVAVPVTVAAWMWRVPVVTHESDYSPGLANKLIAPFSRKILFTFPETARFLKPSKSVLVGSPVRPELFLGSADKAHELCAFTEKKPSILVMGGSQGAQRINDALRDILPRLLKTYNVIHLTGKGKSISFVDPGYRSFEFLGEQLKDVFAAADLVVSRAGANSIFELLALRKPMLLIPLEIGSRGDQILNARSFQANGWAHQLSEAALTSETFYQAISKLEDSKSAMIMAQSLVKADTVPAKIVGEILSVLPLR